LHRKYALVTAISALIGAAIAVEILAKSIGVRAFITVFGLIVLYQFAELGWTLVMGVAGWSAGPSG
jgi:hypothetical protein